MCILKFWFLHVVIIFKDFFIIYVFDFVQKIGGTLLVVNFVPQKIMSVPDSWENVKGINILGASASKFKY
jgi:hypothetical protein